MKKLKERNEAVYSRMHLAVEDDFLFVFREAQQVLSAGEIRSRHYATALPLCHVTGKWNWSTLHGLKSSKGGSLTLLGCVRKWGWSVNKSGGVLVRTSGQLYQRRGERGKEQNFHATLFLRKICFKIPMWPLMLKRSTTMYVFASIIVGGEHIYSAHSQLELRCATIFKDCVKECRTFTLSYF